MHTVKGFEKQFLGFFKCFKLLHIGFLQKKSGPYTGNKVILHSRTVLHQ